MTSHQHALQVVEGKWHQNTLKRFQQKIQDFLSRAPESEATEEDPSCMTEEKDEESVTEGIYWCMYRTYWE